MNNNKADNSIELRNICSISGHNFYIPDYQRGYRWTPTQALQMLHDFIEFCGADSDKEKDKFYCLQPIVVKPRGWEDPDGNLIDGYEVIDGQQRLTTIYLMLTALFKIDGRNRKPENQFKMFSIFYQTRVDSKEFLERIAEDDYRRDNAYDFIDFYHMKIVYEALFEEIPASVNDGGRLLSELILNEDFRKPESDDDDDGDENDDENLRIDVARNVRFIWYAIGREEKATSEDIFTRLNIGKIPLTNAELIKAMFLKESNFGKITTTKDKEIKAQQLGIALQQNKIAEEWNMIEQKLQKDDFWYFLGGGLDGMEYETRIEFIFDLMSSRDVNSEHYHTFNYFQTQLKSHKKNRAAENVWKEVKEYFRELEYWYNDRVLFHLIGFMIECGKSITYIKSLASKKESISTVDVPVQIPRKLKKDEFLKVIKQEVKQQIDGIDLKKITYGNKSINKILLLFNIVTVIENERSDVKFPFDKYKKENWDVEHIASQTDKNKAEVPKADKEKVAWINDMIYYFTGVRGKDIKDATGNEIENPEEIDTAILSAVRSYMQEEFAQPKNEEEEDENKKKEKEIIEKLIRAKQLSMKSSKDRISGGERNEYEGLMQSLFSLTQIFFKDHQMQEDEKQLLGNLALLNMMINRSYGNAFFAIKRMHIQDYDSEGIFIPQATKNVFMKYYSKRVDNMLTWTKDDADAYLAAVERKITTFLR